MPPSSRPKSVTAVRLESGAHGEPIRRRLHGSRVRCKSPSRSSSRHRSAGIWMGGAVVHRAADIGCGAGLSTRPLTSLARMSVGSIRPSRWCVWRHEPSPMRCFVTAGGEAMPFDDQSIDLLTAAGSLNYARDLDATLAEAARVLAPGGRLAVYDFSPGRSFADSDRLDDWFETFIARYPFPPLKHDHCRHPCWRKPRRTSCWCAVRPSSFRSLSSLTSTSIHAHRDVRPGRRAPGHAARQHSQLGHRDARPGVRRPPADVLFRGYLAMLTTAA